jgi:hypothetical protein
MVSSAEGACDERAWAEGVGIVSDSVAPAWQNTPSEKNTPTRTREKRFIAKF